MYEVRGKANETFTIDSTEFMEQFPVMMKAAIESGKEPKFYWMRRVTEGTRKKAYMIRALRFACSGNFISLD